MKAFYLSVLPVLFSSLVLSQNHPVIQEDGGINVRTSNVCSYAAYLLITKGDSNTGELPVLGFLDGVLWPQTNYFFYDTIRTGREVNKILIEPYGGFSGVKPFYLLDDSSVISYKIWYDFMLPPPYTMIIPGDTLLASKVINGHLNYTGDVHIIMDNPPMYTIYDSSLSTILYSFPLDFTPIVYCPGVIVGKDSSMNYRLQYYNLFSQPNPALIIDTVLPLSAADPFAVFLDGNNIIVSSEPGDTAIVLNYFNLQSLQFITTVLYNQSGVNVFDWNSIYFYFQPDQDTTGNQNHKKLFRYNSQTGLVSFNVDKRLFSLNISDDIVSLYHILLVDSLTPDQIDFHHYPSIVYNYTINTASYPYLIEGDFRCPVGINEYDDEKISLNAYPNPTTGDITLTMSGLICGREYLLEVFDNNGRSIWEKWVQAKMDFIIPFNNLKPGTYSMTLHTKNGRKSLKVVKI